MCSVMPKIHVSECDSNDHEQNSFVCMNEVFVYDHATAYFSLILLYVFTKPKRIITILSGLKSHLLRVFCMLLDIFINTPLQCKQ